MWEFSGACGYLLALADFTGHWRKLLASNLKISPTILQSGTLQVAIRRYTWQFFSSYKIPDLVNHKQVANRYLGRIGTQDKIWQVVENYLALS